MPVAHRQETEAPSLSVILADTARLLHKISHHPTQVAASHFAGLHERSVYLTMLLIAARLADLNFEDVTQRERIFRALAGTKFSDVDLTNRDLSELWRKVKAVTDNATASKTKPKITASDDGEKCSALTEHTHAFFLMQLYEQSLDYRIKGNADSVEITNLAQGKKRKGQFYTPIALARKTAATALQRLLSDKRYSQTKAVRSLKILDPAMGAGVFLLCALEILEEHCRKCGEEVPSRTELAKTVYGVDVDPVATEVTALVLWLYCTEKSDLNSDDASAMKPIEFFASNLRCADALLSACSNSQLPSEFFLWDLQFPEVFSADSARANSSGKGPDDKSDAHLTGGFDAVVSNPPWELTKPNAQEFFSVSSPDFRKLSKQEALIHTTQLLDGSDDLKSDWLLEINAFKKKSEFIRQSFQPLFQAQGEKDLNIYKLFLDLGFSLLRQDGCMAMLVPSGILVDKGAVALRQRFLTQGQLYRVQSFINSDRTFKIHPSFAYSLIGVQKGGQTSEISVSFGNTNSPKRSAKSSTENGTEITSDSSPAVDYFTYQQKDITFLSPKWLSIFDVSHPKDLQVLKKIHQSGTLFADHASQSNERASTWTPRFRREFDMTNDSHLFRTVAHAEAANFKQDIFGNWLQGNWQKAEHSDIEEVAPNIVPSSDHQHKIAIDQIAKVLLPLYEGRMVGQFDYSEKCHVSGSGRTAVWHKTEGVFLDGQVEKEDFIRLLLNQGKPIRPHHLVGLRAKDSSTVGDESLKTGYLAVGSATNVRTMLASALFKVPCGNSVPAFHMDADAAKTLNFTACLNSFVFDYTLRMRITGNNINYFMLQECPLPTLELLQATPELSMLVAALNLVHVRNSQQWLDLARAPSGASNPTFAMATSKLEQLQMRAIIDAIIADAYGLTEEEFSWLLRDCDLHQSANIKNAHLPSKGFWRVGKTLPAEMRHPVIAVQSFRRLRSIGRIAFLKESVTNASGTRQLNSKEVRALGILSSNLSDILSLSAPKS